MRKAVFVCVVPIIIPLVVTLGGCSPTSVGIGGAGGSGGSTSGPTSGNGTNGSTSNGSTGNTSSGKGSTSNGWTGNAGTTGPSTSGVTSVTTGGGDQEPANMNGMTAAHNAARAAVSPPANPALLPLSWNSTVAAFAQTYSETCVFQHSGNQQYGENIFATTGTATPQEVVTDWVSEDAYYNYANNTCSQGECGHYTQVVWRDTMHVGCGVSNCTTNSPFGGGNWQFWVCDYDPPGNYVNEKPY